MRFHIRGGASPTVVLRGYKAHPDGDPSKHATDVVVMRYARLEDGTWKAPRPEMRLRRSGPLQQRLTLAFRRLRRMRRRGRKAAPIAVAEEETEETPEQAPA
jgi:hypothetical protein